MSCRPRDQKKQRLWEREWRRTRWNSASWRGTRAGGNARNENKKSLYAFLSPRASLTSGLYLAVITITEFLFLFRQLKRESVNLPRQPPQTLSRLLTLWSMLWLHSDLKLVTPLVWMQNCPFSFHFCPPSSLTTFSEKGLEDNNARWMGLWASAASSWATNYWVYRGFSNNNPCFTDWALQPYNNL